MSSTRRSLAPGLCRHAPVLFLAAFVPALAACERSRPPQPTPPASAATAATAATMPAKTAAAPPSVPFAGALPAPERIVAIGDLHGDFEAARKAFRVAGATDAKDEWIGGKLVVVQTGDEIDRGDDDRKILDWVEKLKGDAEKAGGAVVALVGNHEIMNVQFDFRYVTDGAFTSFDGSQAPNAQVSTALAGMEARSRSRAYAFAPGGAYATMLSRRPVVAQVGGTVFVHGGVLPKHVALGLDKINENAKQWLLGKDPTPPRALVSEDGPLWTRMYSAAPGREECATLGETLKSLDAKRMVMGHTVQRGGISQACEGKAWRIDVGMSRFFGGSVEVLEIKGDTVNVLKGS